MRSSGSGDSASLHPRVSQTAVRAPRASSRWTVAAIAFVLSACSPVATTQGTPTAAADQLIASSSGVCQAIGALPDLVASERAFTNLAHGALHVLAADPRLDRALAARVLESMEKVEADLKRSADVAGLGSDLAALRASADSALESLGEAVPPCAS